MNTIILAKNLSDLRPSFRE